MNRIFSFVLALLFSTALSTALSAQPQGSAEPYKQPHAHSSGAELLYYCEQTEMVVDQLRCDYYVQGVADLATIPQQGIPMACVPQGKSRSQLMEVALSYLKTSQPSILEVASAASLILKSFQKAFPCPKNAAGPSKKAGKGGFNSERAAIFKNCASAGGDKAAIVECVDKATKKLEEAGTKKPAKAGAGGFNPERAAIFKYCASAGGDKEAIIQCVDTATKKLEAETPK